MCNRKLFISVLSATCLIATPVSANVGTEMQTWFDSMSGFTNTTPPSSYKGQTLNGYSAGGFYARTPVKTYQLGSMTPPSLDIGCGGIDLTAGAFSFINKQALIGLFQNIGTSLSYAFLLAIQSSMPDMANLFKNLQDVANKVNAMQVNSCQMTKGIPFVEGADLSDNMSKVFTHIAGEKTNIFSDAFDSLKKLATDPIGRKQVADAESAAHPQNANLFSPGNVVWEALKNVQGLDDQDRQLLMSLTGTIIISAPSGVGVNSNASKWDYIPPTGIKVDDFIGDGALATANVTVFQCVDMDKCLTYTTPQLPITPFVGKVSKAVDALKEQLVARGAQNINNFKLVDAAEVPVWKIISVSTLVGNSTMIDAYTKLIATEIAYSYFGGLIKTATQGLAGAKNGSTPPDAKNALTSLSARLDALSSETIQLRSAAFQKVSSIVEMERQIQLMHQAMVAGIPSQAFTSMTVFH